MSIFKEARSIYLEGGLGRLFKRSSNYIGRKIKYKLHPVKISFTEEDGVFRAIGKEPSSGHFDWYMPSKNIEKTIWCVNFQKYYERFISWLNEGDVVLEVGAATGEFTIPAAKKIGRDGLLFSFEADLRNFKCLTKNLKIKKLDNVRAFNEAVSNESGKKLEFGSHSESPGSHHFLTTIPEYDQFDYEDGKWKLETKITITLDEFCKENNIERLDMIKLTVNGHETKILEGSLSILKNTKLVNLPAPYPDAVTLLKENNFDIAVLKSHIPEAPLDKNSQHAKPTLFKNKNF